MSSIKITIDFDQLCKDKNELGQKRFCDLSKHEVEKAFELNRQYDRIKTFLSKYHTDYILVEGEVAFYE